MLREELNVYSKGEGEKKKRKKLQNAKTATVHNKIVV